NLFVAGFIGSPPMNFLKGRTAQVGDHVHFQTEGINVRFTPDKAQKLKDAGYVNKDVVFGIRPQEIHDKLFFPDAPDERVIRATIEVVEPVGSETFLMLAVGDKKIQARVAAKEKYTIDREIELVLNLDSAHVFDPQTEKSVF
ncbi:MAG: TOBE domain-containing protein, partial [Candidatus Hydrogenedentota bacterium]